MFISYKELLLSSLRLTWRNKALWIFAFFGILLTAVDLVNFLEVYVSNRQIFSVENLRLVLPFFDFMSSLFFAPEGAGFAYYAIYSLLSIAYVGLIVLGFWFAFKAQITTIKQIYSAQKQKDLTVTQASLQVFQSSHKQTILSLLGLYLTTKLTFILLALIMNLPVLGLFWFNGHYTTLFFSSLAVTLKLALFFIAVLFFFIILFAINYIILQKQTVKEALVNGARLFWNNFLISIETAILVFVLHYFLTYITLPLLQVVFITMTVLIGMGTGIVSSLIVLSIIFLLMLFIFMIIGALSLFQLTLWTQLFVKLTETHSKGFTHRLFAKLFKRT